MEAGARGASCGAARGTEVQALANRGQHAAEADGVVFQLALGGAAVAAGELLGGVFPTAAAEHAAFGVAAGGPGRCRRPVRRCSRRARCRRTIPTNSRARRRASRRWASWRRPADRCRRRLRAPGVVVERRRVVAEAVARCRCRRGRRIPIRLRSADARPALASISPAARSRSVARRQNATASSQESISTELRGPFQRLGLLPITACHRFCGTS